MSIPHLLHRLTWGCLPVLSLIMGSPAWAQDPGPNPQDLLSEPASSSLDRLLDPLFDLPSGPDPSSPSVQLGGTNSLMDGLESQQQIPLGSPADRIDRVPAPDQQLIVVGLLEDQSVQLVDLETGDPYWRTEVGFAPSVVRVDPVRLRVYASGPNAPGVVALDLETGELLQAYGLPAGALDLALDLESGRVFATLPRANSVAVLSPLEDEARELPMPSAPLSVVYDPQRQHLVVGLNTDDSLSLLVVNPENGESLARWRAGRQPEMMALDLEQQRLVVLNSGSQDLSVVDLESNGQRVESIGLDWRPTRLLVLGSEAYITSRDSDRLQIVDLNSQRLRVTYPLGSKPTGILSLPTPTGVGLLVVEAGIPQLHWIRVDPESRGGSEEVAGTGALTGRVLDVAGQAVSGGSVTLAARGPFAGTQTQIQPDGSFLISDLPPGIHLADVVVPEFAPTTVQMQVRAGFVSTQDVRLPPVGVSELAEGIGVLPDAPMYSDELARHLAAGLQELEPERRVLLLDGPLGPAAEFESLLPLTQNLILLDRDERYTNDLQRLQIIGGALGLRYVILTQLQITQGYDTRGSALLNTAVRFLAPVVPVQIPNFTPNQLRSRGLVVIVDLQKDRPGDQARYYEAYGRDDTGGQPMFEDAAAGLFRLQVRNMIPVFMDQLRNANPFRDPPA